VTGTEDRSIPWVRDNKYDDRGCPQGLSASALVVDAVIADVLRTFERGEAKLFVYSDNIAIACRTKAEARTMHQALLSAFAEHPSLSGQVELRTIHDARRADYGFEHLGYKIKKRRCGVEIAPTTANKEKLRRLYGRWVRAERARTRVRSATNDKAADAWKRKLLSCFSAFRECSTAARHRDLIRNDPDRALRSPGPYPQRTRPLCLSEPLRRFNGGRWLRWYLREGHKIAQAYERGGSMGTTNFSA
jgi:hypothetical protein